MAGDLGRRSVLRLKRRAILNEAGLRWEAGREGLLGLAGDPDRVQAVTLSSYPFALTAELPGRLTPESGHGSTSGNSSGIQARGKRG